MIRLFIVLSILFSPPVFAKTKGLKELHRDLQKINKSINQTRKKMQTLTDTNFLPETYFILAELLIKKSKYLYSIKQIQNPGLEEKIEYPEEKLLKVEAIEIYNKFITKFPKSPLQDKALFFIAHEYRELGQHKKMSETYQKLVNKYPKSKYWSESQLILANHIYDTGRNFDRALTLYRQIIDRPTGPFTSFAYYKSGLCHVQKEQWKKALLAFEKAIQQNKKTEDTKLPEIYKKTNVERDALLAMVLPYSEIKRLKRMGSQYKDPITYFRSLSPDLGSYKRVLRKLAKRLVVKKRYILSVRLYTESLKLSKDLNTRIDILDSLYVAMKKTKKRWPVNGLIPEISKTVRQIKYASQLDKGKKESHLKKFEVFSRDVATRFQERAQKTQEKRDYQLAIKAYKTYLETFPKSKQASSIKLNLAECYYNINDFINAAIQYEYVGRDSNFSSSHTKKVLNSAIQSYTQALKNPENLDRVQVIQARNGIRSMGWLYIKKYKKNPIVPEILFHIGRTYYDERDFDKSIQWLSQYIKYYPRHKDIAIAVDLILDSHNQTENYDGLIQSGTLIAKNKSIKKSIRKTALEIVKQAQYKKIQIASGRSSPNYTKNLLKLASKYKNPDIESKALYEAFLNSKKDLKTAYSYGEQLSSKDKKYAKSVIFEMGEMALKTADFKRAAKYFEMFAKKYPKDSKAKKLLQSAAEIREFMREFKLAKQNYRYLKDKNSIARVDYLAKDWKSLRRSAAHVSGVQGKYWKGLAIYHTRGSKAARSILKSLSNRKTDNYEENAMAAHSLYLLSMELKDKYKKIQMRPSRGKQIIQKKTKLFEQLTSRWNAITKSGNGEWAIASLYELGHIYQEFAEFLRKTPAPKNLTPAQGQEYKKAISEQAKKYDLTATDYFKQCTAHAEKAEIFTAFAKACVSKEQIKMAGANNNERQPANIESLHQKLFESPQDINLLIKLGQTYAKSKNYLLALLILNRASELDPKVATPIALQGMYYLYLNDFESAKLKFDLALKKNSKDPTALWGMVGLLNEFGYKSKIPSLRKQVKKARPLGPVHSFVKSVM